MTLLNTTCVSETRLGRKLLIDELYHSYMDQCANFEIKLKEQKKQFQNERRSSK